MPTFTNAEELNAWLGVIITDVVAGATKGMLEGGILMAGTAATIVREQRFNTGQLTQSIHAELISSAPEGSLVAVSVGQPYGPFVERDTIPHWAPIAPLLLWAQTKIGRSGFTGTAEQLAYVARAKIARQGTTGIHMMQIGYTTQRDATLVRVASSVREAVLARAA